MTRPAGEPGAASGATRSSADGLADLPLDDGRFPPGTVLAGRYRVIALLGRGGMGEVYRADDLRLRQAVALKILPPTLAADPVRLAHFHHEVRLARQVSHPGVCRVHDLGEADGLTFLTMEHVDGEDLAALLRRVGRLPAERAVVVARQICAGLAAAHEQGVVHRDLKPANVMIDGRGRARLTDFGLAILADDVRGAGERAGTPAYMAPEQLEGRPVSKATDLYALGLVLYEMFTGHRAFESESHTSVANSPRTTLPPPPSRHVSDLGPGVEQAILQCLEPDPQRRPPSAAAVAAALSGPNVLDAAIAAGETPSPEMVAAAGEGTALHPGVALGMCALAVAANVIGFVLLDHAALVNRVPLDKPPDALADRARTILDRLGISAPTGERAFGFNYDRAYLRWVQENDRSPRRWEGLAKGQPAAIHFWYRQSARPMRPFNDAGIVTARDPPLEPGMALVRLDTEGRLLELVAPMEDEGVKPEKAEPPWNALLAEAGLDPSALRASASSWLPPVFADTTAAFEGAFPQEPTIPLRAELAACGHRPVAFHLRGPWDDGGQPRAARTFSSIAITGMTAVLAPVLLVALLLARRNDRLGRSDRRGAFRIAVFAFGCDLIYALLRYGHAPSPLAGWFLFAYATGRALFDATAAWILYAALEPYVRRRWPEALVAWSRLLAGRFNDARVGRDVLVAALGSAAAFLLFVLGVDAARWRGEPVPPMLLDAYLGFFLGPRRFLAWLAGFVAVTAVIVSLMLVLLFVLLKAVLRRHAAAAVVLWAIWSLVAIRGAAIVTYGRPSLEQYVLFILVTAITVFVVVRYGLLASAVHMVMLSCLLECPSVMRLGTWRAEPALLSYAVVACFLAWGLYASISSRPFRWEGLLER